MPIDTQTILITGASRGLGLSLARELARQGWSLLLTARGAQELEKTRLELLSQTRVEAIAGDVADPAHQAALLAAAHRLGGLDALVNNASTLGQSPLPGALQLSPATLETIFRTNVFAPLALIQTLSPTFKPGVRVLNVSSDAASGAYAGWAGYGSSKAALEQLSNVLAAEQPEWKIYWVDPGDMRTRMHQDAFPGEDISDRPMPETSVPGFVELLAGRLPSGRYQARSLPHAVATGGR